MDHSHSEDLQVFIKSKDIIFNLTVGSGEVRNDKDNHSLFIAQKDLMLTKPDLIPSCEFRAIMNSLMLFFVVFFR